METIRTTMQLTKMSNQNINIRIKTIPKLICLSVIVDHTNLSLMAKPTKVYNIIIIHKSTLVTIQDIDKLQTNEIIRNIKLSLSNRPTNNNLNFSNKATINNLNLSLKCNNKEDFKDMNMVLNKTKHITQQRVGYKVKIKLITISTKMVK